MTSCATLILGATDPSDTDRAEVVVRPDAGEIFFAKRLAGVSPAPDVWGSGADQPCDEERSRGCARGVKT